MDLAGQFICVCVEVRRDHNMTGNQVVKTGTQMQKCVQTGRAIDAKANGVEIGISGEIAKAVRGLMMREGARARGTSERACSSGMSRRRRMANRISSGSCSSAELQVLVIGRS
jgi:hypothetical protein